VFVAASIRTTSARLGTLTQTSPPGPAVITCGPPESGVPILIVATTRLVLGSTRVTASSCSSATHTEPALTATPSGCDPTGIDATVLPVTGSILRRRSFS